MSKYETYKQSGIDWIGDVPKHWQIRSFKNVLLSMTNGTTITQDPFEEGIPISRIETISDGVINLDKTGIIPFEYGLESYYLTNGDILFSHINSYEYVGNCAIYDLDVKLLHGMNLLRFVPNKSIIEPYYLLYLIKSDYFKKLTQSVCNRAINQVSISNSKLKNFKIVIPADKSEQLSISNYLDHQTQKIDRLIASKKAQLAKLKELRQIEINNAVTKGLDPNVEMKDSGIAWLGEIPEHWELKRLKNFTTKIGSGVTPKGGSEVYEETGIPLFRSQNIHFDGLRIDDIVYITEEVHQAMSGSKVEPNDVLLNITGASIGRCYFYDGSLGEANVNQHVCILRTNSRLDYRYLQQFMSSDCGQSQIFMGQTGTSREGLNFQDIKSIFIPTPPPKEQIEITNFVKIKTNAIDRLIRNTDAQIEKLQELRKIKIYEAVTGKIKVEGYA